MPYCYLRRPAVLWLVSYLGMLFLLQQWGVLHERRVRGGGEAGGIGERARAAALAAFERRLEPRQAALLGGVVLGERRRLPRDLQQIFRDAGAAHVLVASGSNVGAAMGLGMLLAVLLGASRRVRLLPGLAAAAMYTAVAGADAPLLRAFLTVVLGVAAFFIGRDSGRFQALVLACWFMAVTDPPVVFGAGFQLSFAAALGLVASQYTWKADPGWPSPFYGAAQIFLISLAAQIAVAPIIAVYWRQVSLVALGSNLLLVPLAGLLIPAGAALVLVNHLLPDLAGIAGLVVGWMLLALEAVAAWFAGVEGLRWEVRRPGAGFLFLYYAAAAALWCRPSGK